MNIPAELKQVNQWVTWRYQPAANGKPTKVPFNPIAGISCDVQIRDNYNAFDTVMAAAVSGYDGVGFCVTDEDIYTGIDLDNPYADVVNGQLIELPMGDERAESIRASHMRIVAFLNSYTEWSPSNRGLRIFVKGKLPPEWGSRIGKVEIYSRKRFLTVTGRHVEGTPYTIEDRQQELIELGKTLGLDKQNLGIEYESRAQTRSDSDVFNAICASKVGESFQRLYHGDMSGYGSGSEADQALANYIGYFTDNKEQAYRLFLLSTHYANRPKLHERTEYLVGRVINKSFDQKLPPVDFSQLRNVAEQIEAAAAPVEPDHGVTFPDGMLGFIAEYIYNSAPFAVPEYALGGAIGLLAGICGRAYNISGAGLNQYVVIIGRSGSGKDSVANGISRLLGEFSSNIPAARLFQGPRYVASAPALYKLFDREKGGSASQVCIFGEFGEWLKSVTDPRADATKQQLVGAIMDIYGKSGAGSEAGASAYSDRDKNVASVSSPAFSIIGDTVPESFYEACTEGAINKGLLPRMLLIERKAPRPQLNPLAHAWRADPEIVQRFGYLLTRCMEINERGTPVNVGMEADAKALLDAFQAECDAGYHSTNSNAIGNIWSRAYLKALKLAALVAVGFNWINPTIFKVQAEWAIDMARRDVKNLMSRVTSGEVSIKEHAELSDIRHRQIAKVFLAHVGKPYAQLNGQLRNETNDDMHDTWKVARFSRIKNLCMQRAPWNKYVPQSMRDRDFEKALDELNDVFRVEDAQKFLGENGHKLVEWKMQTNTKLMGCFDFDALTRIAADE